MLETEATLILVSPGYFGKVSPFYLPSSVMHNTEMSVSNLHGAREGSLFNRTSASVLLASERVYFLHPVSNRESPLKEILEANRIPC